MSGKNIPAGEFKMAYGSPKWVTAWKAHSEEWNRPECQEARMKAQFNGLPRANLHLLELLHEIKCYREALEKGDAVFSPSGKPTEFVPEEARRHEAELTAEFGRLVADSLLSGNKAIPGDMKKIMEITSGLTKQKGSMKIKILTAYDKLSSEWLPGEAWLLSMRLVPLVTKAALRERVFDTDPDPSDAKLVAFSRYLKELGLSKLPERAGEKLRKKLRKNT